jgi:hypothetical protein
MEVSLQYFSHDMSILEFYNFMDVPLAVHTIKAVAAGFSLRL